MEESTVFLGQIDGEFMKNFASIALKGSEERSITIHNNEPEFIIISE